MVLQQLHRIKRDQTTKTKYQMFVYRERMKGQKGECGF